MPSKEKEKRKDVVGELMKDVAVESPYKAVEIMSKIEQGRRFLQQGTVSGAAAAAARAKAVGSVVGGGLMRLPWLGAAIEGTKGLAMVGTNEMGREGYAEEGEDYLKGGVVEGAARAYLNPADYFSKVGAAKGKAERQSMESQQKEFLGSGAGQELERYNRGISNDKLERVFLAADSAEEMKRSIEDGGDRRMGLMAEPDPREEARRIARAIRQQRGLDGGGG